MTETVSAPASAPVAPKRSLAALYDRIFALYRPNAWALFRLGALFHFPIHFTRFVNDVSAPGSWLKHVAPEQYLGEVWWYAFNSLAVTMGMLTGALAARGERMERGQLSRRFAGRWVGIVLAAWLVEGVFDISVPLVIVPIIIVAYGALVTPVVAMEGLGPLGAIPRSIRLARGSVLRILLSYGLAMLAVAILDPLIAGEGYRVFPASGAGVLIDYCLDSTLYPFLGFVLGVLYVDLREQREGYDLEVALERLNASTPAATHD